jgi:hypothetical protein
MANAADGILAATGASVWSICDRQGFAGSNDGKSP